MHLNYYHKLKVARALAENAGLSLSFAEPGSADYNKGARTTEDGVIHVPAPKPEWTQEQMSLWEYMVYHEIGHNMPKVADGWKLLDDKNIEPNSPEHQLLNILEDHRQESCDYDMYEGRRRILATGRDLWLKDNLAGLDKQIEEARAQNGGALSPEAAAHMAVFAWDAQRRAEWQPEITHNADKITECLPEEARHYYDKLMASGDRFDPKNKTAEEEWDILRDLMEYLDLPVPPKDGNPPPPSKGEGGGGKGDDDGDEEGAEGAGSSKDGSEKEKELIAKLVTHSHEKKRADPNKQEYQMIYEPDSGGEYIPDPEPVIHDLTKGLPKGWNRGSYARKIAEGSDGKALANAARRLLQVKSQKYYQHGLKKGRLGKNLHRVTMSESGEYQRKVFKKKLDSITLDTSVTLLVDCSGSMSGSKYIHAAKSAVLMSRALTELRVPHEVLGFTEHDVSEFTIFKSFASSVTSERLIERFSSQGERLAHNPDGEAVLWAYDRILAQPTKRKVIITLSDGAPACMKFGCFDFTRDVIKKVEREGRVEIYGIGILDSTVKRLYKDYAVIKKDNELEAALISVLKDKLLK